MRKLVVVVAALAGLTACRNACQDICIDMAAVAQDQCGLTVYDDDIDLCIDAQKDITGEERQACNEFGGEDKIAEEWTCDDIADYFPEG